MKTIARMLLAACTMAASAQAPAKPAAQAVNPASTAESSSIATKLPSGVPAAEGALQTAFSLRYQDLVVGTGAEAAPNKLYTVQYTGWLGANGRGDDGSKFDSSYDHRPVLRDALGNPVLDANGQPQLGDAPPFTFPQGYGRVIQGWDLGFTGMKVGGKRRLFIPWQLAYGAMGRPGPDTAHPGIPGKADLIFDVELIDVAEMPSR